MVKKPTPSTAKEGPPRWTYVAGSIVAIGTLAWGVFSYFLPKPESSKPVIAAVPPAISVSGGNGNVAVGTMSGGQITNVAAGAQATQISAPRSNPNSKP